MDINNFKSINDNYGHRKGDEILSKVGSIIYKVYSKYGYCYRCGGDEFAVILKHKVFEENSTKHDDIYKFLTNLINSLNYELEEQSDDEPLLKNGVAQGFGIYYAFSDCSKGEDYISFDAVLKIADDRMYKNKKRSK